MRYSFFPDWSDKRQSEYGTTQAIKRHLAVPTSELKTKDQIYRWITEGILLFREWYQPVDFGHGVIAHATLPPDWKPQSNLDHDHGRGMAKWEFIVKRHIPSSRNKRILDLGCSSGLYSLQCAKGGAKEVIAIDRDNTFNHRSTNTPPDQDVISQAQFVKKAFELLNHRTYPIIYRAADLCHLDYSGLGHFDYVMALCVLYHCLDYMPEIIKKLSEISDTLILEANTVHGGELGKWSSVDAHVRCLLAAGFENIMIDAPADYPLPVIVATKKSINEI